MLRTPIRLLLRGRSHPCLSAAAAAAAAPTLQPHNNTSSGLVYHHSITHQQQHVNTPRFQQQQQQGQQQQCRYQAHGRPMNVSNNNKKNNITAAAAAAAAAASVNSVTAAVACEYFCDRAVKTTAAAPVFVCNERVLRCGGAGTAEVSAEEEEEARAVLLAVTRRCPLDGRLHRQHWARLRLRGPGAVACLYRPCGTLVFQAWGSSTSASASSASSASCDSDNNNDNVNDNGWEQHELLVRPGDVLFLAHGVRPGTAAAARLAGLRAEVAAAAAATITAAVATTPLHPHPHPYHSSSSSHHHHQHHQHQHTTLEHCAEAVLLPLAREGREGTCVAAVLGAAAPPHRRPQPPRSSAALSLPLRAPGG